MQNVKKGDIAVSENGDVVVISRADVQADDTDSFGRIHIFHVGTFLRSSTLPVGSRWNGKIVRVVLHASELLRLAEAEGYDLTTPAEKPDSDLTEVELLQRKVAQLEQRLNQAPATDPQVVARQRTEIAALQN
jgi:hypothetical protein